MTDEKLTEQDLSNACTHGRTRTIAPDIRWCLICGAIQESDQEDWTFPESHMHAQGLLCAAGTTTSAMLHGMTLSEKQLRAFEKNVLEALGAFTGHADAAVDDAD